MALSETKCLSGLAHFVILHYTLLYASTAFAGRRYRQRLQVELHHTCVRLFCSACVAGSEEATKTLLAASAVRPSPILLATT